MATLQDYLALIDHLKAHLQRGLDEGGAIADEVRHVTALLDPVPPLTGDFGPSEHAITAHLDAAFGAGSPGTAPLIEAILPLAARLPWRYSYEDRDDLPGLGKKIAFAELIGPEAPFRSGTVCLGLTLIAPETLYPVHRHPAVELYYVVAGTAFWSVNGTARSNPPGAFILHPSQIVHSMQTGPDPLLAVYTWSGDDVKTLSSYTF